MQAALQQDRRQYPRTRVSWPIVVNAGANRFLSRSLDISPFGAKVRTKARLKTGTPVQLEVVPPEGPPLRVGAVVWRMDADGLAFVFSAGIHHRLLRAC
jgi:PilZ domain